MNIYSENKKAYFNYEILEKFEAGLELSGHEVKAIKTGKANLTGAYAIIRNHEVWLLGAQIQPYQINNIPEGHDLTRTRKLFLKTSEIKYLISKLRTDRLTLIPLKLYNKRNLIKIELGLGRSKKKADKREVIKKRETDREIQKKLKRE